jgi:hypothetical protein
LLLKVEIVVSSLTFNGVPSGTEGALLCAQAEPASTKAPNVAKNLFITPPAFSEDVRSVFCE